MTTHADFTDEEWAKLSGLPTVVIMAACISDGHLMPGMREMAAASEALAAGVKKFPDNAVLTEIVGTKPQAPKPDETKASAGGAEGAMQMLVPEIEAGVAVAKAHLTVDEFAQLREVLLGAAEAAVERLGDGFMGSGEKVTTSEHAFIVQLDGILSV